MVKGEFLKNACTMKFAEIIDIYSQIKKKIMNNISLIYHLLFICFVDRNTFSICIS